MADCFTPLLARLDTKFIRTFWDDFFVVKIISFTFSCTKHNLKRYNVYTLCLKYIVLLCFMFLFYFHLIRVTFIVSVVYPNEKLWQMSLARMTFYFYKCVHEYFITVCVHKQFNYFEIFGKEVLFPDLLPPVLVFWYGRNEKNIDFPTQFIFHCSDLF